MDATPATPATKRIRTKTQEAKPTRKTLTTSRRKSGARQVASEVAMHSEILSEMASEIAREIPGDLHSMIEQAAFYRAAERGFAPGHELDDWLEAERRVRALYSM